MAHADLRLPCLSRQDLFLYGLSHQTLLNSDTECHICSDTFTQKTSISYLSDSSKATIPYTLTYEHETPEFHHIAVAMRCNHIIGLSCLAIWLRDANTCPVCRAELFIKKEEDPWDLWPEEDIGEEDWPGVEVVEEEESDFMLIYELCSWSEVCQAHTVEMRRTREFEHLNRVPESHAWLNSPAVRQPHTLELDVEDQSTLLDCYYEVGEFITWESLLDLQD